MQGARRGPWWFPRASRATPQTPLSLPTLRDRADLPSCGVLASLLGIYPTSSAPPCLRGNLPRSRPREMLRQPRGSAPPSPLCITKYLTRRTLISCTFAPAAALRFGRQSITEFIEIVASRIKTINFALAAAFLALAANTAPADGVSAYLPLNLEPEIERQIERVLILADEPVLKRPFAVALVELALPEACKRDRALCAKVKKYLERYSRDYGVTHASATGALTHGAQGVVPNQHGLPMKSDWEVSAQAYVQPSDYFLASGGVISY